MIRRISVTITIHPLDCTIWIGYGPKNPEGKPEWKQNARLIVERIAGTRLQEQRLPAQLERRPW